MTYYLKHNFDPDFDHTRLSPKEMEDGSVDHYELSYVQNVRADDVLAEWVDLDEMDRAEVDSRFIFDEKVLPAGPGTGYRSSEPDKLFAARDGFVFYDQGVISVRTTLNVRHDVDFTTGNIEFVSNLNVFGTVRSGFYIKARNIDIEGVVEGAAVHAREGLVCRSGIKGEGKAFLEANKDIKAGFCENATLKSGGNILVKGSVMHSKVYAGDRLAVGGRLVGCHVYSHRYVYVGEQLGGGMGADLRIILGYKPDLLYIDNQYDASISELWHEIRHLEALLASDDPRKLEYADRLKVDQEELAELRRRKARLWETISRTENLEDCRVLVPGVVKPGVEVSIGNAYLKVDDYYEDVHFYYEDMEVKIGSSATVK